jgi:hypothetical protein
MAVGDLSHWLRDSLQSIKKKIGINFTDKQQSLSRYSSLADSGHRVCLFFICYKVLRVTNLKYVHCNCNKMRTPCGRNFNIGTEITDSIHFQMLCTWKYMGLMTEGSGSSTGRVWGPPSLLYNRYSGFSLWVRRETDHSPPTCAKIKKMWVYTPTPPYVFMV